LSPLFSSSSHLPLHLFSFHHLTYHQGLTTSITMPTPRRPAKSQGAEKTPATGPSSRTRPPSGSHPKSPTQTSVAASKRTGSTLSNDESRKKGRKAPYAATGRASTPQDVVRLSQEGFPPSNRPSNTPVPAAKVTTSSLRGGLIHNHSSPPSTATSSTAFPSPSQSSELGSVASWTGRTGPRSALHSGSLELASMLEAVKRLLERYCYRVSPFIVPSKEMLDISVD
jgi:hypothetical protein